jgi:hypothetical protein
MTTSGADARTEWRWILGAALIGVAVATLLGLVAGASAARSAATGASGGAIVQVWASALLLQRTDRGMVAFLGVFARAAVVRIAGGTTVVMAAWLFSAPRPLAFLAGFGAVYVWLEVVTNLVFVRIEDRSRAIGEQR